MSHTLYEISKIIDDIFNINDNMFLEKGYFYLIDLDNEQYYEENIFTKR